MFNGVTLHNSLVTSSGYRETVIKRNLTNDGYLIIQNDYVELDDNEPNQHCMEFLASEMNEIIKAISSRILENK